MFPAYLENPQNCSFEGQNDDEKILLLLRAHPITNLSWIIPSLLIFFIPFVLPKILTILSIDISLIPETYKLVLLIINYLLVLVIAFEGFLYWYFNVYIVSSKNIVDVDFNSILFKNIDIAPLRNVEDVSSSMGGILQSIFQYGKVVVQTAGTIENIDFENVPFPHKVADFILDQSNKLGENK